MNLAPNPQTNFSANACVIRGITVAQLTEGIVARYSTAVAETQFAPIVAQYLQLNRGGFTSGRLLAAPPLVEVVQQDDQLALTCTCQQASGKLCEHQAAVLRQLMYQDDFRLFFDEDLRRLRIQQFAANYGLQNEPDLNRYFGLEHIENRTVIWPRQNALFPVNNQSLKAVQSLLLPPVEPAFKPEASNSETFTTHLVLKQHKYYRHLILELYNAPLNKDGGIKNPLSLVNPLEKLWQMHDPVDIKFYTAVSRFQNMVDNQVTQAGIDSLKLVVRNPLNLICHLHQSTASDKVSANSLRRVYLDQVTNGVIIDVVQKGLFYEVSAQLTVGDTAYPLNQLDIKLDYFIAFDNRLYLARDVQMLGAIRFFKQREANLLIHESQFEQFRLQVLDKLEKRNQVNHQYAKPATPAQLYKHGFNQDAEKIIYLSDFGQYVMILPVMRYGEVEIAVRSQKQINSVDSKGKYFTVQRNESAEQQFTALLLKQHHEFEEQLTDDLQYFYLHKTKFLSESWFLNAFDEWYGSGITILGFNELTGNNLNPHKAKITVRVLSGLNWFNTELKVYFGKRRAPLKHLHKAIRNKSKFVQLDDGTLGIIPAEWIERFEQYFSTAQIGNDDLLFTPKANFTTIAQLYDDNMLDIEVKREIQHYQQKLSNFTRVTPVEVPAGLQATLRPYQHQGLNWLNFLDDFNFGGCLADDMGLGKTLQIIAFILLQRHKQGHQTNLLVVPTSLIFNWQAEVQKFAPSIKMNIIYGADRLKNTNDLEQYELVVTSYGTLMSDVHFLKNFTFNYVFLDESQHIKNPDSQRYKAVRLLQSRNRVVITGTPIENNTFDLYAQLSFANPGLLGNRQYFKEIYLVPIDQFKDKRRAQELHQKIKPFILRRTKQEVASELPEKTEMVLYCEMPAEQRNIYNAYEKEFRELISTTTQETLDKKAMHVLKGLTKLRQICDSPALLSGEKLPGNASAKLDMLIEQVQNKAPNHKILIFSQFVSMLNLIGLELEKQGIGYTTLTGSTRNREAAVNQFQQDPGTRVFLVSLKAGGTGLNLTAADYIYLVDPWWNPAIENQAIDRAYRIGQHKNVVAIRLICRNTVEEKMMQLQESKRHLAGTLIPDTAFPSSLTRDELLSIV
jgi:SNF2 family DNA or RNA helicase